MVRDRQRVVSIECPHVPRTSPRRRPSERRAITTKARANAATAPSHLHSPVYRRRSHVTGRSALLCECRRIGVELGLAPQRAKVIRLAVVFALACRRVLVDRHLAHRMPSPSCTPRVQRAAAAARYQ